MKFPYIEPSKHRVGDTKGSLRFAFWPTLCTIALQPGRKIWVWMEFYEAISTWTERVSSIYTHVPMPPSGLLQKEYLWIVTHRYARVSGVPKSRNPPAPPKSPPITVTTKGDRL